MKKFKLLFLITTVIMTIVIVHFFLRIDVTFHKNDINMSNFKILAVEGERIFYKSPIIDKENILQFSMADQTKLKNTSIYVDSNTSYQLRFFDTFITVLPNSLISYQTPTFIFKKGEFFWKKDENDSSKTRKASLVADHFIQFSNKGRLHISDSHIKVWNYKGQLTLWSNSEEISMEQGHFLSIDLINNQIVEPVKILQTPEILRPDPAFTIKNSESTLVQFQWKDRIGTTPNSEGDYEYILKLFSSRLMGKLPESQSGNLSGIFANEQRTDSTNISVDFSTLIDSNTVYWQIYPFDKIKQLEGEPSTLRKIELADILLNNKTALQPPKLHIEPPSISGNIVIFSGEADPKSRLFVDGQEFEITPEGKFGFNLTFDNSGIYTVKFELVAPTNRKNEKKVIVRIL